MGLQTNRFLNAAQSRYQNPTLELIKFSRAFQKHQNKKVKKYTGVYVPMSI